MKLMNTKVIWWRFESCDVWWCSPCTFHAT